MEVKVVYLGLIADITGKKEERLKLNSKIKFSELLNIIFNKYPKLNEVRKKLELIILVNGLKYSRDEEVNDGDEVAIMTVPSGG